ncbi:SDR family NAD(P)-dependent oxidoreductase [Nocardia sp. NPDC101769]|uniref:SDR family NAD(P)-dependent oxidoreductase n=1 Tax=Nocardia sp. NPDC101769 TaxID=3364333 RepID=UPI0038159D62
MIESELNATDVPVAIVGLGALYPKAADLSEFWTNVFNGVDCITDVPEEHWRIADYYHPDPRAEDRTYSKRGGFIPEVQFDPLEFGIPPRTVEATSILQLLSLVVAKQTMQDSGCFDSPTWNPRRTGVILGASGANSLARDMICRMQAPLVAEVLRSCGLTGEEAEAIAAKFKMAYAPWQENSFPGVLGNVVAGRIANRFDFGAVNCTTDAACASSLAAVNMAISELALGRADFMLAGGCDMENSPTMFLCFSKTPALSISGKIAPFDENGDGTLIGQGIGMLGLKRLADAQRDGDRVYAVIRGTGTSSDGRFKSIYAPRAEGQIQAVEAAYRAAGVAPESIRLLEAHGTGTPIGDYVEVDALKQIFTADNVDKQAIAIGTVKSQIGHTKCAAGAAGLIKTALALYHKVLPPTINVTKPKAAWGFDDSAFYPNTSVRPWITDPGAPVRRAGVSAFGFGGTNFHCVLEESPAEANTLHVAWRNVVTYLWHARTPQDLAAEITADPFRLAGEDLVPVGHARAAIVAQRNADTGELRTALLDRIRNGKSPLPDGVFYSESGVPAGKIAAVFAGQGSQYTDMGRGAAIAFPEVLSAFEAMSAEFAEVAFGRIVFPPSAFDPLTKKEHETALRATEYAQPAIGALAQGQYSWLRSLGLVPDGALGHSFGELTALWAAGSIDTETFRTLARARGAAMARRPDGTDSGAMAAVAADAETVGRLLTDHPGVRVCNLNAPAQVVVGGGTEDVAAFVQACTAQGVGARALPVAAAFHTPLVEHAVAEFAAALASATVQTPEFPVYANTADAEYGADSGHNKAVLAEQIVRPVAFAQRVEQLYEEGFRVFVEFGPKSLLAGLIRATVGDREGVVMLSADGGPQANGEFRLAALAAELTVLGLPLAGLNRGVPPEAEKKSFSKATVVLNGHHYVPEERRLAYADALENGYRIERSTTVEASEAAAGAAPAMRNGNVDNSVRIADAEVYRSPVAAGPGGSVWELAAQHLNMHRAYLSNQLHIADRVSGLLAHEAGNQARREVIDGIDAIARHSIAISEGHVHASNVLRGFAELEAGNGVTPTQRPAYVSGGFTSSALEYVDNYALSPDESHLSTLPATSAANGHATNGATGTGDRANGTGKDSVSFGAVAAPTLTVPQEPAPSAAPEVLLIPTDPEEIGQLLLDVIADKTGYPPDMLELSMTMEADLGIDSIKRVEILSSLQEKYPDIPPPSPEKLFELSTLQDVVDFTAELAREITNGPGTGEPVEAAAGVMSDPKADRGRGIVRRRVELVPLPATDELIGAYRPGAVAVVAGARTSLADALVVRLEAMGWSVHDRAAATELEKLDLAVWVMPESAAGAVTAREHLLEANVFAAEVLTRLEIGAEAGRSAFVTATRVDGSLGLRAPDFAGAVSAGVGGLVKTVGLEAPSVFVRAIDIHPDLADDAACEVVFGELTDCVTTTAEVGVGADSARATIAASAAEAVLAPIEGVAQPRLDSTDLVLVTGGARGITADCVLDLAGRCEANFLLVGSTPLDDEPDWAQGVADADLKRVYADELREQSESPNLQEINRVATAVVAQRQVRMTLDRLNAEGPRAVYLPVDITDAEAVAERLGPIADEITAFVHGAGTLVDKRIRDKNPDEIRKVLGAKLFGFLNLLDVLQSAKLRHLVLFTSVAGFYGNIGQSDYAMGNEALNRLAVWFAGEFPEALVTAVNWGPWEGGMVRPELAKLFRARGVEMVPIAVGAEAFSDIFARPTGSSVELVGPRVHPVTRPVQDLLRRKISVRRQLAPVYAAPALADHQVAGHMVLPATWAVGCLINVVEQVTSIEPMVWTDFRVLKGIVVDDSQPRALTHDLTRKDDGTIAVLARDDDGRPRYRLTVHPVVQRDPAPVLDPLPELGVGDPDTVYEDKIMFHGPAFQGYRRTLRESETELVAEVELVSTIVAGKACETPNYDPILSDVMVQVAGVWIRRHHGVSGMPAAAKRVNSYRRAPSGEPFIIVADGFDKRSSIITCNVTAFDRNGEPLAYMVGVEGVTSEALNVLFAGGTLDEL